MKDKILYYSVLITSLIGILMVYSSSYTYASYRYDNPYKFLISQSIFFIIGLITMTSISKVNYSLYKKKANLIMIVSFILLVLVLIPGIGIVRNGSRSWFGIGPFGIQPSELSKIALIIFMSKYLSSNDFEKRNTKKFILPPLIVIAVFFLLIMLEPDFGTGMIIVSSLIALIFITGTDTSIFIKIGLIMIGAVIVLILLAPYRLRRITSFINPWSDPLGSGYQLIQSLYAIAPSGLLGKGLFNSTQKLFYLPEPQTDFIFSIISEELGFIGVIIITILFLTIFYKSIKISLKTNDLFGKYLSFGLSFSLIFQTILNLLVVIGLVPVTGVTLPFISYGGTSLIVSMIMIGIILNINKNNS